MPHEKKVSELMIHLTDYPHIPYWFTIKQAIAIVKKASLGLEGKLEPTILLIFDEKYQLMGSLSIKDLIRGIEKKFTRSGDWMSKEWDTPVFFEGLFTAGVKEEAEKPVGEIMTPVKETAQANDSIIKAIYIMMEKDLTLLPVLDKGTVVGVIRLNEIFNEISKLVLGD
ncbi:MAG: CBS domain-containing protein [Deltaproteobacteria bacterium]|nr:CBS domain-containing protein [Deltaproteobacteria bacterium]